MNALRQQELYHAAHKILDIGEMAPLVVLQVNMNGTGVEQLVDQGLAIMGALRKLDEAFSAASPHGRDFQISGGSQLQQIASAAWRQRRLLIQLLRDEMELYTLAISDQRRT